MIDSNRREIKEIMNIKSIFSLSFFGNEYLSYY